MAVGAEEAVDRARIAAPGVAEPAVEGPAGDGVARRESRAGDLGHTAVLDTGRDGWRTVFPTPRSVGAPAGV